MGDYTFSRNALKTKNDINIVVSLNFNEFRVRTKFSNQKALIGFTIQRVMIFWCLFGVLSFFRVFVFSDISVCFRYYWIFLDLDVESLRVSFDFVGNPGTFCVILVFLLHMIEPHLGHSPL